MYTRQFLSTPFFASQTRFSKRFESRFKKAFCTPPKNAKLRRERQNASGNGTLHASWKNLPYCVWAGNACRREQERQQKTRSERIGNRVLVFFKKSGCSIYRCTREKYSVKGWVLKIPWTYGWEKFREWMNGKYCGKQRIYFSFKSTQIYGEIGEINFKWFKTAHTAHIIIHSWELITKSINKSIQK